VKGERGTAGSPSRLSSADRVELLSVVESQIEDIYRELDVQVSRLVQLQQHVEDLRVKFRALAGDTSG
jgi:hypothetical protein